MTSFEFQAVPGRPSDADRDKAIEVLRENAALGRLSHDTFVRRMELVLAARGRPELQALIADLPVAGNRMAHWVTRMVGASSSFTVRLRKAWRIERLPALMLPEPGPVPLRIGRDYACGLRIAHDSVSRLHAELLLDGDTWRLRDLGSMNGTWINGRRVAGAAAVRPGDVVTFGSVAYRLAGGRDRDGERP